MIKYRSEPKINLNAIDPVCPIFGKCGGCQYQDIAYQDELSIKESYLKRLLSEIPKINENHFAAIVPSPKAYHYRSRLDLRVLKTKEQQVFIGFQPMNSFRVIPAESCHIAMQSISDFIPALKHEAAKVLPQNYRNASLVVKTGDDHRVLWGGIGRRSLQLEEENYLWTRVRDKKIFFALDTFFQANLSILPLLIDKIKEFNILKSNTFFYDLYGGVGLFSVCLYDNVQKVILIEENPNAVKVAQFNKSANKLTNLVIKQGRVEIELPGLLNLIEHGNFHSVAMVDPPRNGLSKQMVDLLIKVDKIKSILYLSCNPEALARDLSILLKHGLEISKLIPFDFFPRTRHIETLVLLKK